MKKVKKDKDFIKAPYFEGGRQAMDAFVKKHLIYPEDAKRAGIEGRVTIQYVVDFKGKIIHTQLISGLGFGCDEEALRIVKMFPFKVPEGGKIKSKYSRKVHIHFHLQSNKQKSAAPENTEENSTPRQIIAYNYVTSPPSQPTKSNSYQITINLSTEKPDK